MDASGFDSGQNSFFRQGHVYRTGRSIPILMKWPHAVCIGMLAIALILATGIRGKTQEAAPKSVSVATVDTRIAPGFVLNVAIEGEEELSHEYSVDSKGNIHFKITD